MQVRDLLSRVQALTLEHQRILSEVDTSRTRIVTVASLNQQLSGLSSDQAALLDSAVECAHSRQYRAAIVMAWTALIDLLEQKLASDGFSHLNSVRPKWKVSSREELTESQVEFQIIEAAQAAGLYGKTRRKTLQGLLNTRNRAAHPGSFHPTFNRALGYIEEVIDEFEAIQSAHYPPPTHSG